MLRSKNVGFIILATSAILLNIACFCGGPSETKPKATESDTSPYVQVEEASPVQTVDMDIPLVDLGVDLTQTVDMTQKDPTPVFKWEYRKTQNKMSDETIVFAQLPSDNIVNFDFPYQGNQNMVMTLRAKSISKMDAVIFTLPKAQFLCNSWDGCYATVRLDQGKPFKIKMSEPSDHSSNTLFVNQESAFMKRIQGRKKMLISFEFFREGSHVFEFDLQGLDLKSQFNPTPTNK